jgi:hypothetical protein
MFSISLIVLLKPLQVVFFTHGKHISKWQNIPLPGNTQRKVRLNYADLGTNTQCSDNINPSAELNRAR